MSDYKKLLQKELDRAKKMRKKWSKEANNGEDYENNYIFYDGMVQGLAYAIINLK